MDSRSKWGQPDGFHPNGLVLDEDDLPIRRLDPVRWAIAEERTAELIACIRPNWLSEKHRMAVASYVQRLITQCVPCQVFTFGSVPLKTYLPDGDIDLTAFSEDQNVKDKWANEVRDMLKREEKNEQAEFQVKEVQYIQAEVKIIKCLVDNIVVDISFNQLGGLCTLCFLEEIDNLINQNHLFKRSVILIKAWCYYESRLLGAHHGLISTYALETLVLYIFHVFNNSFAGPFEVLYRFLEFFSKFDWANFCVSLWGPVPISSLPSMAAEPPRRDGGDLLLNKMFLSACSTAYSVFPGGQENREQPFIAKHFNVVDPLRINNNLGRSVSKGNFYRIRTAFSLGAEQLTGILDCQEDSIVTEVNQFFVNTWKRHGNGCRPDAPILDAFHLRQVDSGQDRSLGKQTSRKKATENVVSHGPDMKQSHCFLGSAMQSDKISVNPIVGITDSHRDASGWAHQNTQRSNLSKKLQNEEIYRTDILHNRAHTMHQFARTCSSPELTNLSSEATSSCRRNVGTGEVEDDTTVKSNHARRARDPGMENLFVQHSMDEAHISESPSCHDRLTSFGLKHSFGNTDKSISGSARPACFSGDDRSLSHEEVQDFMNRASSSGIRSNGACVQMPANLASHPLLPFMPPIVGYNHHNVGGTIPADLASHEPDWGSVMHYPDGLFPAPFSQHFNAMGVAPDQEEMVGRLKGSTFSAEAEHQDDDYGYWTDSNADSVRGVEPECEEFSTASSRLSPTSPTTSSRTKASSESSWDGKPPRRTNALRHNLGNVKHCFQNPVDGGWRVGGEPADQICDDADDDCKVQVPFSTAEPLATSVTSSRAEVHQLPGFGPPHTPYPNSMFPFTPLLVRPGSQQGVSQNHAVLPVAFYPAGPPVPFFAMVPFCNLPNGTGTSGTPTCQHDAEAEKSTLTMGQSASGCSSDSTINPERSSLKTHNYKSMDRAVSGEDSGETGSDIFDSDFASHWKNLQYGRLCQNSRLWHPFVYPPSVVVMPQHLQRHLPFDPPENLSPRTSNTFVNLVPASAMQPASCKPTGVSQRYSAEVSIHRNGTGTYFPNPKIIKDRQISTSRQYQGDWNNDRDEQLKDREANWHFNSKPRFSGRAQARYHYEKPTIKMDRSSTSQIDRPWDTFSRNSNRSYRFPNGPSTSRPARNGPDNVDYSVHPMRSAHLNEVSPSGDSLPLLMLYPCAKTISYGSKTEQLQFRPVGSEHFVGTDDEPELCRYSERDDHNLQTYPGGESELGPPSPDYMSSPRFLR